ncbi:isoprenylcysteine carboxylmethyltransferase family protein [Motilimonas pumila]|nr:isoprenylcysteine carboxylmethyltransferase family protein [Motilimonas pumila]
MDQLYIVVAGLALAVPIIVMEFIWLKPYANPSAGLNFTRSHTQHSGSFTRTLVKLLGLGVCFAFVAFIYWLFPEYRGGYYDRFFDIARYALLMLVILALPYFYWVDRAMVAPKDSYWQLGMLCLGQAQYVNWKSIVQLLLGWTVKLFFLPLMFIYASNNLNLIIEQDFNALWHWQAPFSARHSLNIYQFFNNFLFYIDLLFVTVGYCCTFRLFDSHIRSTEPTFLGWVVALLCYQPFWGAVFGSLYISYSSGQDWSNHFWQSPNLHFLYAIVILALVVIYVWASMAFGIRFSNLTHRGILTNGPFRYTKHPAYISKNLSWWLIFMPFLVAPEFDDKIRLSLLLLLQNLVYFMRARTEEKHLSQDPDYVAYAQFIEQKGCFAWVGSALPILKFKPGHLFNLDEKDQRQAHAGDAARAKDAG